MNETNIKSRKQINLNQLLRSYLWVGLVLHALNQHTLDNLHIMLLLVSKDSWEIPTEVKKRNF